MISFYSDNLVDQANVTVSSENLLFPKSNLKDSRRTKIFRSNSNSDSIVFDFQETSIVDSILLVDDHRNGFGFSIAILEMNGTNEWSDPAFSQAITINHAQGFAFAEFPQESYRFARLVLSSTLGYCEVSKVFIGKKIAFANGMGINLGWTYQDKELSTIKENRYGQKFIDVITRQKQINFSITSMDPDELDQVLEIYDNKGSTKPFWMRLGCADMINDQDRFAGMYYMTAVPGITNRSFALYDISMTIEEAM